jgi:putative glutamine amidotransferase
VSAPRIGIPLCLDEAGRWRPGRRYQYIDAAYAEAVCAAGGVAVHLPLGQPAEALLDLVDGLLLPGGDDLEPPHTYPPNVEFDLVPGLQLDFDRELLRSALEARAPILAVCYGMQLLALEAGGSLHYDLATDLPEAAPHRLPEPDGRHGLLLEPGTRLHQLLGPDPEPVNSLHHQAVATPGASLRVAAYAEDGVIESIEGTGDPFCVGVQWHPEKQKGTGSQRLFEAFVESCRAGR